MSPPFFLTRLSILLRHGDCDSDMSDVNLVVHTDKKGHEKVFGSLHVGPDVCRLHPNADGSKEEMDCQPQATFMPEEEPHDGDEVDRRRGLVVAPEEEKSYHYGMKLADPNRRRLVDDSGSVLDIMVVYTGLAMCRYNRLSDGCQPTDTLEDNMLGLIELAIEETNTAFAQSGVSSELRLVHAYRHPDYIEPTSNTFYTAIDHLRNKDDNQLEDVHELRELYGADLVAMVMGNEDSCGIAYIGPWKPNTFSATSYLCATGYYSFGHEIAHSKLCRILSTQNTHSMAPQTDFGAYHDRGTENSCGTEGYNYGWRDPDADFRTILAYNCRQGKSRCKA